MAGIAYSESRIYICISFLDAFNLQAITHFIHTNLEGMPSSELPIPAHLVCCQTPQVSHANIFSPSSSLAPHVQSTFHSSVPRSFRNRLNPCLDGHFPRISTDPLVPRRNFTVSESLIEPKPKISRA